MGDYTLAQVELYLEAAEKQGREDMRNSIIAARCAKADAKDFKKIMKGFD
ncbi:hypothetical protein [uncultured Pseudomonas sp.]|nr:hypothetical protein [uncultured Pseudomonas sp.]